MTKQTIVGRVAQLAKADIDALLDQAEDPQKTVDQLIHDYTGHISEAEDVVEGMVRDLRLLEQDHAQDAGAVAEWGGWALSASRSAEALRARATARRRPNGSTPSPGSRSAISGSPSRRPPSWSRRSRRRRTWSTGSGRA